MILLEILFHVDKYLSVWTQQMGAWVYLILFAIVFCETGLVVTPFLPGDSLLFALGSVSALPDNALDMTCMSVVLIFAAFLGDNVNYFIGKKVGPRVFSMQKSKWFNPASLTKTKEFYEKYGPRAVIFARFIPIVRTFAPFVAGIGQMNYRKYISFSLLGSLLWTQIFLWAGRFFGQTEVVKRNFQLVILAVIGLSIMPGLIAWIRSSRKV